jgi:alanine or glycine:cation symporter, AGCS family
MSIFTSLMHGVEWALGWPLIIYVISSGIICTIAFRMIQVRYFFQAWRELLWPTTRSVVGGEMTPFQAFVNTLSANLGNGTVAGMATAIYAGGPGAAFWVVIFGLILMAVRFGEVFLSTYYGSQVQEHTVLGGPMLYLNKVAGGYILSYAYAFCCLLFGLIGACAIQTNSIGLSLQKTWNIQPGVTAVFMFAFLLYVIFGGAQRIIRLTELIVPVKVIAFFISMIIILIYHYQTIGSALQLICIGAFTPIAASGGAIGFTVVLATRYGMHRSIMATESGLGTAAILFGFTGQQDAFKSGIISMLSTFISTLGCFIVALCIVASGVWNSGETSTALTILSFNTVFGWAGGWLVSFLSASFGLGVLVTFAYITRATWLFLTGGRFEFVFTILYPLFALGGVLINVHTVWRLIGPVIGGMLLINLFGVISLLPVVVNQLKASKRI